MMWFTIQVFPTLHIVVTVSACVSAVTISVARMIRGTQLMTVKHGANHVQIIVLHGVITVKSTRQALVIM
jgi:negative regulator of sigma E activity